MEKNIEKTMRDLEEKLEHANDLYYNQDAPEISDFEYDAMLRQLEDLERKYPEYASESSPTKHVGGSSGKSTFEKVQHVVPMKSLPDVFSAEEVENYLNGLPDTTIFCVEEKIDGLSMSATYENGVLVRAETRGDGQIGELITENAKHITGIPRKLKTYPGIKTPDILEVRAEVYLPVADFERLNEERELAGKKLFVNPRNAAAGLLRTKEISEMANAGLSAFVFNIQRIEFEDKNSVPERFNFHSELLLYARAIGFSTVTSYATGKPQSLIEIKRIGAYRSSLPYWTDGAVLKVDDIRTRLQLGETEKYPLWAIAFKYPPEEKETVVKDIVLQTGRTGRVTPVAILEPVFLSGTSVSKATLHNPAHIAQLNIKIGSTVLVRKAAEIIPEIIRVISSPDSAASFRMDVCPECGTPLEISEDGKSAICPSEMCPAQFARHLLFFASRPCMNIDGFGPAVVNMCIDNKWVEDITQIYHLSEHRSEMEQVDGFGKKSTDKLLAAIEKSKGNDIDRLIKGLGISGVGRHIGANLAARYPDLDSIMALKEEELEQIPDVGSISAKAIVDFFASQKNRNLIEQLRSCGVNMKSLSYGSEKKDGKLSGMTFVITGTLPTMGRDTATTLIEQNGGKVSGSVSKKTNYLLAGEAAGSKLEKANSLGVKVISEEDLNVMLA